MKASVSTARRLLGELLGTALLLAVVIGSGLMAERLSGGNVAVAAAQLGLPKKTLYDKLARHQLEPETFRHSVER